MAFGQEIKDFVSGFNTAYKLSKPSEAEEKRRLNEEDQERISAAGANYNRSGSMSAPHTYGSGGEDGGSTSSGGRTSSAALTTRFQEAGADPTMASYLNTTVGKESGGNRMAKNPSSSATGLGQFTTGTWAGLMRAHPELNLTAAGRTDEAQSARALVQFTRNNSDYLKRRGYEATPGNLYVAHFLGGAGAARVLGGLRDDPNQPASSYADPAAVAANKSIFFNRDGTPKSLQSFYNERTSRYGRRADLGDDEPAYAQMAAGGGIVLDSAEFNRRAREEAMGPAEDVTLVEPGGWGDPTVSPQDAAIVGPQEAGTIGPENAGTVGPTDGLTLGPSNSVRARQEVPLPPSRPSGLVLDKPPAARHQQVARRATQDAPRQEPTRQEASTQPKEVKPEDFNVLGGIADAIEMGFKAIGDAFGFSDNSRALPRIGDYDKRVAEFHSNAKAATPQEVASIDRTIDPDSRLSADARAVARMYAGVDYYTQRGEYKKAAEYSASLMLYIRNHMQHSGAVAEHLLKEGNVRGATRAIVEAHNQVPDGSSLYVDKIGTDGRVDYRMEDENGDLTERGQANINQLMQLAVGMKNGSEWYSRMQGARAGSLTAAQKLTEKRRQKDEQALGEFNKDDDGEFQASLTDGQKRAFNAMSPAVQQHLRGEFHRRKSEEFQKDRITRQDQATETRNALNDRRQERADKRMERADRKEETDASKREKEGLDTQEWAGHSDRIADAQDALADQLQKDPEDEAAIKPLRDAVRSATDGAREWMKADGGRAKYGKELREITKPQRAQGQSRQAGTETERTNARLEAELTSLERQVKRGGNTPEGQSAVRLKRSEVEFAKRASEYDDDVETKVQGVMPGIFGVDDIAKIPKDRTEDQRGYEEGVAGIIRGDNGITPQHAAEIAKIGATTGKAVLDDQGRVHFGAELKDGKIVGGSRPVYISPEGLQAIGGIWKKNKPKPAAQPEQRAANPFDADAGEKGITRGMARNRREYARLREELGDRFEQGMTISEMRRAAADKRMKSEGFQFPPLN